MSGSRSGVNSQRGSSSVEFAIIASLLFMILFGTIQFGITYHRYQGLNAAAREGARMASLSTTTVDQVRTRTKDSLAIIAASSIANSCPGTLTLETGCVEVRQNSDTGTIMSTGSTQTCAGRTGQTVVVNAKYRMEITIPLWASPAVTITGRGEFRCE